MTADAERLTAIRAKVESQLDDENHEALCACGEWPASCVTYGKTRPWSHSAERAVELAVELVTAELDAEKERAERAEATLRTIRANAVDLLDADDDSYDGSMSAIWVLETVDAALAGDQPEAAPEPNDESGHTDHTDPYCATHCIPGIKHSQCGCTRSHAKTTPEPPHLDPEPWFCMTCGDRFTEGGDDFDYDNGHSTMFRPHPVDENGKAYSDNIEHYQGGATNG